MGFEGVPKKIEKKEGQAEIKESSNEAIVEQLDELLNKPLSPDVSPGIRNNAEKLVKKISRWVEAGQQWESQKDRLSQPQMQETLGQKIAGAVVPESWNDTVMNHAYDKYDFDFAHEISSEHYSLNTEPEFNAPGMSAAEIARALGLETFDAGWGSYVLAKEGNRVLRLDRDGLVIWKDMKSPKPVS